MRKLVQSFIVLAAATLCVSGAYAASGSALPVIRDRQLLVNGKPYLAIGGELHNSSTSSPAYMELVWAKLQKMNVRTVVSTVNWEDFEPEERKFDYTTVDAQIAQARRHDMRLVLIWFGAFKNAGSTYAPTWVRRDTARFHRAVVQAQIKEVLALGAHRAIGFSVFDIEDGRVDGQLAQALALLNPAADIITKAQAEGRIAGVLLEGGKAAEIRLGGYLITVQETRTLLKQMLLDVGLQPPPEPGPLPLPSETEGPTSRPFPADGRTFGLIIAEGPDSFLLIGKGFTADFAVGARLAEVDRVEEGEFVDSAWHRRRVLNGDERLSIIPMDRLGMIRLRLLPEKNASVTRAVRADLPMVSVRF